MTIRLPTQTDEQLDALDKLYRSTQDMRLRTRVQMILLAAEQNLSAPKISEIVRKDDSTVRYWLKRYLSEGIDGLHERTRPGAQPKVTEEYKDLLYQTVRRRPRSLDLPFSLWTLERLADYLEQQTGIRIAPETVRRHLKASGFVLSRPQHKISSPDPEYAEKKRRLKRSETI
jgi:transposase